MDKHLIIILFFIALNGCQNTDSPLKEDYTATAVEFFNGIYGCDSTVVDRLASPDVIITYPIFEKLFNTRVLRGQQVVRRFAAGFCSRWAEPQITIHRAISEGENVVLVWSFRARNVGSALPDTPPSNKIESWGGITLFQFDENGKVLAEIGEESVPGPAARTDSVKYDN